LRVANACRANPDYRPCDDFGNRVIAINQVQRSQRVPVWGSTSLSNRLIVIDWHDRLWPALRGKNGAAARFQNLNSSDFKIQKGETGSLQARFVRKSPQHLRSWTTGGSGMDRFSTMKVHEI